MAQFTRRTILAAVDMLPEWNSHARVDRFALEHSLEDIAVGGSLAAKGLALSRYLIQNPEAQNEDGSNLTDVIVGHFVQEQSTTRRAAIGENFTTSRFSSTTGH